MEEGAGCGPLRDCAYAVVVNYGLEVWGRARLSVTLARRHQERVPVTLLPLLAGHTADVRLDAIAAVIVPLYVMVFPRTRFGHLDKDLLSFGLRSSHLQQKG